MPAQLLVGDDRISINPKLNNIVKGWEAASHGWIVMADSNVLMPPDYIERLLTQWDRRTGIVSSPPVGAAPEGIWAELECGFLNTYQARWQLAADAFGLGFAHGKTMLWRREILDGAGGIRALAAQPAEDAAGTQLVRDLGSARAARPEPLSAAARKPPLRRSMEAAASLGAAAARVVRPLFLSRRFFQAASCRFASPQSWLLLGALPIALAAAFAVLWYGAEALLAATLRWPLSGGRSRSGSRAT